MGKNAKERMARQDEEYRKALHLDEEQELPREVGQTSSTGAARGGRGARQRGRGKRK